MNPEEKQRVNDYTETSAFKALLLSEVHEAIFSSDKNYTITYWNKAAERIFGWTKEEALGKNSGELLKPELERSSRDRERSKLWDTGYWEGEVRYVRKDGTGFYADVNSTVLKDANGKDMGQVIVARDITEHKRAMEELKKYADKLAATNKELESYSYSISHDLRAPLRAMKGFSKFLLEDYADKLDEQAKEYIGRIVSGSDKMNEIIDDMLNLSTISRQEIQTQEIDLSAVSETVFNTLCQDDPAIEIEAIIEPEVKICGDFGLMKIAISNLIGNAWKYSSKTPDAKIEFGALEKAGQKVYFVRDNGVGFDMAFADKLFEPFRRFHTESEFPGTGIGLAIVKRVIEKHGGTVWAESAIGKGATFYFTCNLKPKNERSGDGE